MTTPTRRPMFLVRFVDGTYAGSPLATRTTNKELAGVVSRDRAEAERVAASLGGEAVEY